ncbi:MAG: hypothetical protein ACLP6G_00380 [Terriglobales bacterium]
MNFLELKQLPSATQSSLDAHTLPTTYANPLLQLQRHIAPPVRAFSSEINLAVIV